MKKDYPFKLNLLDSRFELTFEIRHKLIKMTR